LIITLDNWLRVAHGKLDLAGLPRSILGADRGISKNNGAKGIYHH
jgi:hypothetical protein